VVYSVQCPQLGSEMKLFLKAGGQLYGCILDPRGVDSSFDTFKKSIEILTWRS